MFVPLEMLCAVVAPEIAGAIYVYGPYKLQNIERPSNEEILLAAWDGWVRGF